MEAVADLTLFLKAIHLRDQDRFMWEAVTEAVFNTSRGDRLSSPAAIDREIEVTRRKKRARERIEDAKDEYRRYEQRFEALKKRHEEMAEQAESKADALNRVLQSMGFGISGRRVGSTAIGGS